MRPPLKRSYPHDPQVIHRSSRHVHPLPLRCRAHPPWRPDFCALQTGIPLRYPPLARQQSQQSRGPVDNLCTTCHSLCTACGLTCGNRKTFPTDTALTCEYSANCVWTKYSFAQPSSTACRRELLIQGRVWSIPARIPRQPGGESAIDQPFLPEVDPAAAAGVRR